MDPLKDINWPAVFPQLQQTQLALAKRSAWSMAISVVLGIPLAVVFPPSLVLFIPLFWIFLYAWRRNLKSRPTGLLCILQEKEKWLLMAHSGLAYQDNREAEREREKHLYYCAATPLKYYSLSAAPEETKPESEVRRVKITAEIYAGLSQGQPAFFVFSPLGNNLTAWWNGTELVPIPPFGQNPQQPKTKYASKDPSFTYQRVE